MHFVLPRVLEHPKTNQGARWAHSSQLKIIWTFFQKCWKLCLIGFIRAFIRLCSIYFKNLLDVTNIPLNNYNELNGFIDATTWFWGVILNTHNRALWYYTVVPYCLRVILEYPLWHFTSYSDPINYHTVTIWRGDPLPPQRPLWNEVFWGGGGVNYYSKPFKIF